MKITFITPSIKTGGGNRVFIEIANLLCREHDVQILYPLNSEQVSTFEMDSRVKLTGVGIAAQSKPQKLLNLFRVIRYANRHLKNHTIIYTDPIFSILARYIKTDTAYRFIQADDYRIFDDGAILGKGFLLKTYKKLCLGSYRSKKVRFIFNSQFVYHNFLSDSGRNDVPLQLVHPAINHHIFNTQGRELEHERPTIGLVARKHPLKGILTFIDAWKGLEQQYRSQAGKITFISHDDLSGLDTTGIVIKVPHNDREMADFYRDTDIFISTSWWEGFGLPPLEAMACGCPCIVSKSGGVDEYARENANCLMFEPKDTTGLQSKIIEMLENEDLRHKLATQGRQDASSFTWENATRQLLEIIR